MDRPVDDIARYIDARAHDLNCRLSGSGGWLDRMRDPIHPDCLTNGSLERAITTLRSMADRIETKRLALLARHNEAA